MRSWHVCLFGWEANLMTWSLLPTRSTFLINPGYVYKQRFYQYNDGIDAVKIFRRLMNIHVSAEQLFACHISRKSCQFVKDHLRAHVARMVKMVSYPHYMHAHFSNVILYTSMLIRDRKAINFDSGLSAAPPLFQSGSMMETVANSTWRGCQRMKGYERTRMMECKIRSQSILCV